MRRVLIRFCKDSNTVPTSLLIHGIEKPTKANFLLEGGFANVHRIPREASGKTEWMALKTFRFTQNDRVINKVSEVDLETPGSEAAGFLTARTKQISKLAQMHQVSNECL